MRGDGTEVFPAIATHPGVILKAELQARGLTPKKFAGSSGIDYGVLKSILQRKTDLAPDIAQALETALGIPAVVSSACRRTSKTIVIASKTQKMEPKDFPEKNTVLTGFPIKDMESGEMIEVEPLNAFFNGQHWISCWHTSIEDIGRIIQSRNVWVAVISPVTPPIAVMTEHPFVDQPPTEINKNDIQELLETLRVIAQANGLNLEYKLEH